MTSDMPWMTENLARFQQKFPTDSTVTNNPHVHRWPRVIPWSPAQCLDCGELESDSAHYEAWDLGQGT